MTLATSFFASMLIAMSRHRSNSHENPTAAEAVRVVLEQMRNEDFADLYALYNADPADDPDGEGTAPGNRFQVAGLAAMEDAPNGLVGEVIFPSAEVEPDVWQLREDMEDDRLGMPRDLNGDSLIDDQDHSADYLLMPICVRVEWAGRYGRRQLEMHTMLTDFVR